MRTPMNLHLKKGALTRTMKRTGKSAAELLRSKSALTRRRAQFAINARKWRHVGRKKGA